MTDDLIGRAEAQTAIQFAARRYTVAHEAHGEGQVVWSDNLINVTDAMNVLRDLPSAEPDTTIHDSNVVKKGRNDEDRTSGDCISRTQAIDALTEYGNGRTVYVGVEEAVRRIEQLPSAQPERKDAVEKAVAVEAISDELMSRFDISTTYAYEVAEKAMNRIEAMAKELERGEQE